MSVRLIPCSACARHVKQGDCACPFCGAKVPCASEPPRTAGVRLSRAALFAASAVGAVLATSDCASGPSGGSAVPLYGGSVPVDAGDDGSSEGGSAQPHYGAVVPPIDAGDASPSEGGSVQPLYGAVVPPVDSGTG